MGLDVKEKNLLKFLTSFILPTTMSAYFVYKTFFPNNPLGFFGLISVSKFLFTTTLRPLYQKLTRVPKDVRKYGKWAIVTGSTSGIGERFCHRLAEKNMSILLISRTMSKLEAVAKDITTANPSVQTQCMAYDFGTADAKVTEKFYVDLSKVLDKLAVDGGIGMLVNNVGLSNDLPELVHLIPKDEVEQMLRVNNAGTVRMSQAVLPYMMTKRSGSVITVSSASCTHPTPLLSMYSATKAFGQQLTRSMYYEYKEFGIDCIAITPYYFVSNMFKRSRATYLAPFPDSIIDATWNVLGYEAEAHPYWCHWLMGVLAKNYHDTGNGLLGIMKQSKARALAKGAAKAKKS